MKTSLARSPSATSASSSSRVAPSAFASLPRRRGSAGRRHPPRWSGTARLPWRRRAAACARSRRGTCRPGRGRRSPRPRRERCLPVADLRRATARVAMRAPLRWSVAGAVDELPWLSSVATPSRVPCIRRKQRLESGQNSHARPLYFSDHAVPCAATEEARCRRNAQRCRSGRDAEADLDALTDLHNHYVRETPITFDTDLHSGERRPWLRSHPEDGPHRLLVATAGDSQRILGYATSSAFRRSPRTAPPWRSRLLAPDAGGRGVGTLLYKALFAALADEDLHRAYAGIAQPNEASVRLHERFGFRHVGTYREVGRKFGRYWDVAWYEKEL